MADKGEETPRKAESGQNRRVRRVRWSVSVFVAFLVHGVALFLFNLPREDRKTGPVPVAPIVFLSPEGEGQGRLLDEQLEFSDTAPLYFPTRWNVANAENIRLPLKSPGDIFPSYEPRLYGSDLSAGQLVDLPEPGVDSTSGALASFKPEFTRAAGRVDRMIAIPEPRIGMVEVFDIRNGKKVFETPVAPSGGVASLDDVVWRPARWVVLMDAVGQIGEAMMTRSSGSDQVDAVLQDLVDGGLGLDKQLVPGYYLVQVGP